MDTANSLTNKLFKSRTPLGHRVAVVAHNCYVSTLRDYSSICDSTPGNSAAENMSRTISCIENAIVESADYVELDLILVQEDIRIAHGHHSQEQKDGRLRDVLLSENIVGNNVGLFLEIKESSRASIDRFSNALLQILLELQENSFDDRKIVIRSFYGNIQFLVRIRNLLDTRQEFFELQDQITLNVLFGRSYSGIEERLAQISDCAAENFDGIELDYRSRFLLTQLDHARIHQLATGIWTIPRRVGEVFVATLRNDVDFVVSDFDISQCRNIIRESNNLLYAPIWNEPTAESYIRYYHQSRCQEVTASLSEPRRPSMRLQPGSGQFAGSFLSFDSQDSEYLPFQDTDNRPNDGFLVSAYVYVSPETRASFSGTMGIVNKSDDGGFALELKRQPINALLRFGVHVDGRYRYAQTSISHAFRSGGPILVTGAYDGKGRVWLFVDNQAVDSTEDFRGSVTPNNSPIVVGADPQGASNARYYLSGSIQHILVLSWTNH